MARVHISVGELDFETIKDQIKQFLAGKETFQDYNFDGSGMGILLDILAYNTHMNAFTGNMLANEMFLDSAELRQSVVSHAKSIGYTPRSVFASRAIIDISVPNVTGSPEYLTMPAGTRFDTEDDIYFETKEEYLLYPISGTTYEVQGVEIFDGSLVNYTFIVDLANPNQRFLIPSADADMSTLMVSVKPTYLSSIKTPYAINANITALTATSEVYFLHESANGLYELTFGDGVFGKALEDSNAIVVSYIVANQKEAANGLTTFLPYQQINGYSNYTITTDTIAYNGAEKESIEDIRFRSPKSHEAQNRAVITEDYVTMILRDYPFIESMNAWGGEYNSPPVYGKVFFGIKPKHTAFLSDTIKNAIKTDLIRKYNVLTVTPEIVDPDYLYVMLDLTVYYDRSKTTLTKNEIISKVQTAITSYFEDTTQRYKMPFYYSPLVRKIDDTDVSISNSLTEVKVQKRFFPIAESEQTYELKFFNAIEPNSVFSTYYKHMNQDGIVSNAVMYDDGEGIIYAWNIDRDVLIGNIGIVDYTTGVMTFTILPYSLPTDTEDIRVMITPDTNNVYTGHNQIISPDNTPKNIDYNRPQGVAVTLLDVNKELA